MDVNASYVIGKKNAEKVAGLLARIYPALFKYDEKDALGKAPSVGGYGLGGVKGLKNLPSTICSRVIEFLVIFP